jgi:hypothetical protein
MIQKGLITYMADFYNFIDLGAAGLAFVVILNNSTEIIELDNINGWIAGAIAVILIKVFYWLRFFDETCHYVRLILESMYSIRYFFILYFIILFAFGLPLYFLGRTRALLPED